MLHARSLIGIFLSVFFVCCSSGDINDEVARILEDEVAPFDSPIVPANLEIVMDQSDVLFFGEIHYVQEHQEFIVSMLPSLSDKGYHIIYDELFHAFSWMVDDYVTGRIDDVPEYIRFFQQQLLEGLRDFNRGRPDSLQMHLGYFDVNHWEDNCQASLIEIEKILGLQDDFMDILEANNRSEEYEVSLRALSNQLHDQELVYRRQWGDTWYDRITEIIDVEVVSFQFRNNQNSELRENTMLANIIQATTGSDRKFLVNAGFVHAQKKVYLVEGHDRLGQMLDNTFDRVYSFVFSGIRGQRRSNFYEEKEFLFDLENDSDSDDLIREFSRLAGGQTSFTPLNNDIFKTQNHKMTYANGARVNAPIGLQFDGVITYPSISIIRSMSEYDWRR